MKTNLIWLTILCCTLFACNNTTNDEDFKQLIYDFELEILDKLETPLEGVKISLYAQYAEEEFVTTTISGGDGLIRFEDLPIGKYSVYATIVEGLAPIRKDIVVGTGGVNRDKMLLNIKPTQNSSPIVITGLLPDPKGSDSAASGTSSNYQSSTGITVMHDGGYEYIQLLALKDIDFSVTPFSVVTCTNGEVDEKGWASGGAKTFKFNLTEGKVSKGSFFYVGAASKVIAGYGNCGKSTDISQSKWIRAIDYKTDGGDGLGDKSSGILGNVASNGTNTSDGVAVFSGTEVTEQSIPVDAIFYGTIVATYNAEKGWGYRIPKNDLYNTVNPVTGEAQPFFGQGTNTFMFAQPESDISDYLKLGGIISPKKWIVPRSSLISRLSYCPGEANLADIELATGVTKFLND